MPTTINLTVPVRGISPLYLPRRDFAIHGGDDIVLRLTIKETDGGSAVDLTDATLEFVIIRPENGGIVYQKDGAVVTAASGICSVTLDTSETLDLAGEYRWQVRFDLDGLRSFATPWGAMYVMRRMGQATDGNAVLTEAGDYIELEP